MNQILILVISFATTFRRISVVVAVLMLKCLLPAIEFYFDFCFGSRELTTEDNIIIVE